MHGLSIYILKDTALLPTTYGSGRGFSFDDEPMQEFDYSSKDSLIRALERAELIGNPIKEITPDEERNLSSVSKRAKAKDWADLERKSVYISICRWQDLYEIKSWKRSSPSGKWLEDLALEVTVPAEKGISAVADLIIEHLKSRNDLPGLPIK